MIGFITGFVVGVALANIIATLVKSKPKEPKHKHFFEPWSELLVEKMALEEGGLAVGRIASQHRTCIECGFTEYRRDIYRND